MAKQVGVLKITGTIDNVCFYKLDGEYYARQKSSLSGERVKTSPAFSETMKHAGLLANASVIGSAVYHVLPKEKKGKGVCQRLTGIAMRLLKEGKTAAEITRLLRDDSLEL